MIANPEYLASEEFVRDKENAKWALMQRRDCLEDYFPADYGKALSEDGGWIMLLAAVHVGKELPNGESEHIHVPHLSIWYAMPTVTAYTIECGPVRVASTQAIIQTPQGPVYVWPHEYNRVDDLSKYLEFTEEQGFFIHFLDPNSAVFNEEKLHYIRSRGVSLAEARRWLLPEVKSPYCCYFTFAEEYSEVFPEWTGTPYSMRARRVLPLTTETAKVR